MQFTLPLFSLRRYSAKMSKAPRRVIQGLLRLRFDRNLVSPSDGVSYSSIRDPLVRNFSSFVSNRTPSFQSKLPSQSAPAKGILYQIYYNPLATAGNFSFRVKDLRFLKMNQNCSALGLRFFSSNARNYGAEISGNVTKKVRSAVSRYRGAVGLQFDAFLRNNYLFLLGAGGVLVCALLWRIMFWIASTFVGISEGMAKYGFLAFSSAIVAFAGLYLRSRFTINPDKVYRMAMRKLNTSAGILEVMGAPLSGSDLRAYVMSGGGFTLKNFKPNLRSKRCFLIFPIRGSERKGLVSVEIRKKKGQYDMKLLAVDIPMGSGPEQRLFLIGDEDEYKIGGGLISELRDPVVKAMTATKEFENIDELEEEEDAKRESEEAERKRLEEIEKMERDG